MFPGEIDLMMLEIGRSGCECVACKTYAHLVGELISEQKAQELRK